MMTKRDKLNNRCELGIFRLVKLVELGESVSLDEANQGIMNYGFAQWLNQKYGNWLPIDDFDVEISRRLFLFFDTCWDTKHPGGKNGLLILISYLAELMANDYWGL